MSKALDHADLIKARLATAPIAGELPVPVDITALPCNVNRQGNIAGDIQAAVQKSAGTFLEITWDGWQSLDDESGNPRLAHHYTIIVWSRTVKAPGMLDSDDVMQAVIMRMWDWVPYGSHVSDRAKVGNGGILPSKTYLAYDCEVIIPAFY